jgi:hypothetical protein
MESDNEVIENNNIMNKILANSARGYKFKSTSPDIEF